jgi:NADH:ubiquinone oxidoreductase subunit F (NADH-binding)/(2Fe-2S) ferredoxin
VERIRSTEDLFALKERLRSAPERQLPCVSLCDTGCRALGSAPVREALIAEIRDRRLSDRVRLQTTGCHGFCERGPVMVIRPQGIFYERVKPEDVPEILEKTVLNGEVIERLCHRDAVSRERRPKEEDVPFYQRQSKVVLRHSGMVDPQEIDDYLALDGYEALARTLQSLTPDDVIEEVAKSGLRGRGGAGASTGMKWRFLHDAEDSPKYIVCNADEGDPGAFMDRGVCEGDPHAILEGMLIGAYAMGASEGYIYVRAEYPIAVRYLRRAIEQAEAYGLLGDGILGSELSFHLRIKEGAGAFVCGEETALMASIEGYRGMPRPRPPYPPESGLFGKPTNINNVETWANVPVIMTRGADWFAAMGTEKSKGTKVFALAGKVQNTGLVEVPMGATLREIVFKIGGGMPRRRTFKAAQMGGPSGGCVPEQFLDMPIDFDSVAQVGAIMGSGGMVVMDDTTCMVELARYFTDFVQSESCGKCVPCRIGTRRMLETLTRITEGLGEESDLEYLREIGQAVQVASLCGLGKTAPNPTLSTLRHFWHEYEAHVRDKKCPAGICKALTTFVIDKERCTGCGLCLKGCPTDAMCRQQLILESVDTGELKVLHVIDQEKCIKCGSCRDICNLDAVLVT